MPILHVRGVPEDLYDRLRQLAQARHRSLSAQVLTMLSDALREEERRQEQSRALAAIRRRRFRPPAGTPTSTDLLREDRCR